MGLFFYHIFLFLFRAGVRIAALFNQKARRWVEGRRQIFPRLREALGNKTNIIWMHCASLGEFEQGRPVLESLKKEYPEHPVLVTFFSPSGFEVMKNYPGADWIFYLPLDGPLNARRFLRTVNPVLAIFVKYEYWYYFLTTLRSRKIPLLMVSALFRPHSPFFKWYGSLHRKMLTCFTHVFVQDQQSADLLSGILPEGKYSVAGDTRFDRVIDIAGKGAPVPLAEAFAAGGPTLIAGSSWPADEIVLQKAVSALNTPLKLILAPHEINAGHISQLQTLFPDSLLYSEAAAGKKNILSSPVLIIDNIGMLSRIYRYAYVCYIGGAFGEGLHNTLEAAVYGKPVIFGAKYDRFLEARGLIEAGGGFSVADAENCADIIRKLMKEPSFYKETCDRSLAFVFQHKGATEKIIRFIQEKRLLTN